MQPKGLSLDYMANYYDRLTPAEKSKMRKKQIEYLDLQKGERVLDVGCGTGPLAILAKMAVGDKGEVCGIDIAKKMIAVSTRKAEGYGLKIDFQTTSVDELPWPDAHFDAVFASLMFHHLPVEIKKSGLIEIARVLKKNGRLLLSDFCTPTLLSAPFMYMLFFWMKSTRYQLLGKLPKLIAECGFKNIQLVKSGFFIKNYIIRKQ